MSGKDASIAIVNDQALDDCPPAGTEQARCEECDGPIQVVRGHRPRRYCSDVCKQKAYQLRLAQKEAEARREQVAHTYPDFDERTIDLLDDLVAVKNDELVKRIVAAIAREVELRQSGLEQVQERFRSYVEMTNERVGNLCGELAEARRELERKSKAKMTKADMRELEQARVDLLRLYQERAREQEEIHRLSELAYDLQRRLGAAQNRITELEQQVARPVHIGDVLFELGAQLNYPELWFSSPEWKERARILAGREYWRRFCERGAALEVKAAYEVAQQRVESNRQRPGA